MESSQPKNRYFTQDLRPVLAGDKQSFTIEFVTTRGEHIGVACGAGMMRRLGAQIDRVLADHPDLG